MCVFFRKLWSNAPRPIVSTYSGLWQTNSMWWHRNLDYDSCSRSCWSPIRKFYHETRSCCEKLSMEIWHCVYLSPFLHQTSSSAQESKNFLRKGNALISASNEHEFWWRFDSSKRQYSDFFSFGEVYYNFVIILDNNVDTILTFKMARYGFLKIRCHAVL